MPIIFAQKISECVSEGILACVLATREKNTARRWSDEIQMEAEKAS